MGPNQILSYFDEGKKLWPVDMDMVNSKRFYELWESVQLPKPFVVKGKELELCNGVYELSGNHDERIGYFEWDDEDVCPVLKVEAPDCHDKFLLTFSDGDPYIYETESVFYEVEECGNGEQLEVIYDVIVHIHENHPDWKISELTMDQYLSVLDAIEVRHERLTIKLMKKISAFNMEFMVKEAARDMALDDTWSEDSCSQTDAAEAIEMRILRRPNKSQHEKRTKWSVLKELELLASAGREALEAEKTYVLSFKGAEVVKATGKSIVIKVKTDVSAPIREGDKLSLYSRGDNRSLGDFYVDLFDGETVCGRIVGDISSLDDSLYARPRKSPREYLCGAFEEVTRQVSNDKGQFSTAFKAALGLTASEICTYIRSDAPKHMDDSQSRAWATAVDLDNSLILIQGPPGTGKTSVLENVLRTLCKEGKRVLVTAPSNTAVDNICRRCFDLPILRFGHNQESISPDVVENCWIGENTNISKFAYKRKELDGGGVYAGTHVGILRNNLIQDDIAQNGMFDAIIFDEAGMARIDEFLLCSSMSKRAILFGDQQQLPPFPLSKEVIEKVNKKHGPLPRYMQALLKGSALEWLVNEREFPIVMMEHSYRCQNPRLLRFSSTLFYDAQVKASREAEYYKLSYDERHKRYPGSTLRLFKTSSLDHKVRSERLTLEGNKPGIDNPIEAEICSHVFYEYLRKYAFNEVTIIAPYKRQVRLIRNVLDVKKVSEILGKKISEQQWQNFIFNRIATVDSFQGGESDAVIICYVRSNKKDGIGFVDDPNRINVAHTRARREMAIVGDIDCLKRQARNNIFQRMERACDRDGIVVNVNVPLLESWRS